MKKDSPRHPRMVPSAPWSEVHCDAGPGLEQSRDAEETVTTGNRDSKGNAGSAGVTRANLLWNNQHAPLACEDD